MFSASRSVKLWAFAPSLCKDLAPSWQPFAQRFITSNHQFRMRRDSIDLNLRINVKTLGPPNTPNNRINRRIRIIRPPSILVGSPSPRASGVAFRIVCPFLKCAGNPAYQLRRKQQSLAIPCEPQQKLRDFMRFHEISHISTFLILQLLYIQSLYPSIFP